MKHNQTFRAFAMSLLSLLLCVAMLAGSTFAWFTDTATTGVNTIVAGNLDMVVSWYDGDSWEEIDNSTKLFKDGALWEPGYTEVAYLKVENNGSLDFKYRMAINVVNEIIGESVTNEEIRLSQILKFAVIETSTEKLYGNRADAVKDAEKNNAGVLATKVFTDSILASETPVVKYYTLVVYMPETTGNEANHKTGTTPPSIELGVKIDAAQLMSEEDSFGSSYDKDALYRNETYVTSTEELANAVSDPEVDKITVGGDVNLPDAAFDRDVTIDLAGNSLTIGSAGSNADGLVIEDGAKVNLINTGSEKATFEYLGDSTGYDAIYVDNDGELNIGGNIDLVVSPEANSAIHADNGSIVNIGDGTNIVVNGPTGNRFAAVIVNRGSTVNMTGGVITVDGSVTSGDSSNWNSELVGVVIMGNNSVFNMTGGTINVYADNTDGSQDVAQAIQSCPYNVSAGDGNVVVNIDGGTFNVSNSNGRESVALAVMIANMGDYNFTNATFNGNYTDIILEPYSGSVNDVDLDISGGTYAFDPSAYVVDGFVATSNGDNTWTVTEANKRVANSDAALAEIVKDLEGVEIINLASGEYTLPNIYKNLGAIDVDIIGAVNSDGTPATVMNVDSNKNLGISGTVKNIKFSDATNSKIVNFMDGNGMNANIVVDNCVFDGATMRFTGVATIKNSTFDGNGAAWSGVQYSFPSGDILIENCKFSGYSFTNLQVTDEGEHRDVTVTVRGCTIGALNPEWNGSYSNEGVTIYIDDIVLENNTIDCDVWTPTHATVTKTNNKTSEGGEVSYKNW